ncbi:DPP IV N-terminal domain-containing protein [Sphingomonas sp. MMS24-JH45]
MVAGRAQHPGPARRRIVSCGPRRQEPQGSRGRRTRSTPRSARRGRLLSFVRGQNLYVQPLAGGAAKALTQGGGGTVYWGEAEFVAQEEMDRRTGYWWSPDNPASPSCASTRRRCRSPSVPRSARPGPRCTSSATPLPARPTSRSRST